MLLVFAQLPSSDILQMQCPFPADSQEEAYKGLKTVLEKAARAVEKVTDHNVKSTAEVFNLIDNELKQHILLQRMAKTVSVAKWIKSLASIFT